ncbi:hypothetical protein NDU88_003572 [Pleurodeles waltl]|uniref:Uncharacterized protein n=1 Tax=Pleurodeles waltl TaxID=8319 RepID=A0AAV7RIW4_PLEWA|nr:hypothetical protein NDU88_003572 [Pleurodeles waltl]
MTGCPKRKTPIRPQPARGTLRHFLDLHVLVPWRPCRGARSGARSRPRLRGPNPKLPEDAGAQTPVKFLEVQRAASLYATLASRILRPGLARNGQLTGRKWLVGAAPDRGVAPWAARRGESPRAGPARGSRAPVGTGSGHVGTWTGCSGRPGSSALYLGLGPCALPAGGPYSGWPDGVPLPPQDGKNSLPGPSAN